MRIPVGLAQRVLVVKKHSPDILFVAGVAGSVGSTVLACRSTLKLSSVLQDAQNDLELARSIDLDEYSEQDRKKDIAIIYTRSAVSVGKLYAPSIVLGITSISMLTRSHNILTKRNAAVTAAYAALEKGFDEYRARVVEKYGEDQDREFRFPRETIKEKNPETGREHNVTVVRNDGPSIYARFFDQLSPSWSPDPEVNLLFINCQQNWANDKLRARGHVFLNEVYDSLGIPRSKEGAVVGWVLGKNSDNYIDFGVWDGDENTRAFVNGREGSILLDFNVDGLIYDKLGEKSELEVLSWQTGE